MVPERAEAAMVSRGSGGHCLAWTCLLPSHPPDRYLSGNLTLIDQFLLEIRRSMVLLHRLCPWHCSPTGRMRVFWGAGENVRTAYEEDNVLCG